jgi:hypothetical protein
MKRDGLADVTVLLCSTLLSLYEVRQTACERLGRRILGWRIKVIADYG